MQNYAGIRSSKDPGNDAVAPSHWQGSWNRALRSRGNPRKVALGDVAVALTEADRVETALQTARGIKDRAGQAMALIRIAALLMATR